jgi:phosphoribosylglycinamide formyltransferase-1
MKRALNAGVPAYVVDPELFPNTTSHSMAVANKLKDMDIELVILAGYDMPLGVIPYQFKNRIIGTFPALYPAFEDEEGDIQRAVLERGVKITGATAYFADGDGRVGSIILQRAVEVKPDDTPDTLSRRVLEDGEWRILSQAVILYCSHRLKVHGNRVIIEK